MILNPGIHINADTGTPLSGPGRALPSRWIKLFKTYFLYYVDNIGSKRHLLRYWLSVQ